MVHELIWDNLTFREVPLCVELHKNFHDVIEAIDLVLKGPIHILKVSLIGLKGPQVFQLCLIQGLIERYLAQLKL